MSGWQSSTRSQRLPRDWPKRRAQVKARAHGQCQATVHEPGCDRVGTECDHIIAGDDHSLGNLQWLSAECHRAKTKHEAQDARVTIAKGAKHPTEAHPGMI